MTEMIVGMLLVLAAVASLPAIFGAVIIGQMVVRWLRGLKKTLCVDCGIDLDACKCADEESLYADHPGMDQGLKPPPGPAPTARLESRAEIKAKVKALARSVPPLACMVKWKAP